MHIIPRHNLPSCFFAILPANVNMDRSTAFPIHR